MKSHIRRFAPDVYLIEHKIYGRLVFVDKNMNTLDEYPEIPKKMKMPAQGKRQGKRD